MNKRIISSLLVLLLLTTGVTACGVKSDVPATQAQPEQNEAPAENSETNSIKKIIYSLSSEPETLDPTLNVYSRSSIVLQNMFRGLYKIGPDDTAIPALAEGYTIDETGKIYTFTLKEGLKWSDGSPLKAGDFEYSWKRVLNPEVASGASWYLYYIKNARAYNNGEATADDVGVKALDDRTLEVTLENPTAYFVELTCVTAYYPVKKDIVETVEGWTQKAETLFSTGPFMAKEIKPKEKLVLVKNPYYIDADGVKIDELDIVFIESPEAELAAYMNGDVDVSDNVSKEALTQYKDTDEFYAANRIGTNYYDINCSKEPYDDARVRKALAMSIDRNVLINNIIQGTYEPAYGFVPYGIPYAPEPGKEYRDVAGNMFEENIDEAKKLLADAGFPDGTGFPTLKLITTSSQTNKDVAQAIQGMWKQNIGINVEIVTFESKLYWDELELGNFDVAYDGWTGDYPDPMTNLDLFMLENTGDDNRWVGEKAEKYNELLFENMALADNEQRYKNFEEAEKILMEEMPIIPTYYYNDEFLAKPYVTGVIKSYIGHTIFEYADINK